MQHISSIDYDIFNITMIESLYKNCLYKTGIRITCVLFAKLINSDILVCHKISTSKYFVSYFLHVFMVLQAI